MSVPVLIPARNETSHIVKTLEALPEEAEPFVIPNGCTDETAELADRHGAVVLEGSPEGKLPAMQFAMRHLGERALEPFVTLDADAQPRFPKRWIGALLKARGKLDPDRPAMVTGPFIYEGLDPITAVIRNTAQRRYLRQAYEDPKEAMSGANLLFDLQNERVLQGVLRLPNVWPFEDEALRDRIVDYGGQLTKTIHRSAMILADGNDRHMSLWKELKRTSAANEKWLKASYAADAPPGSIPYWEFKAAQEAATD
jgi:hypothetical protein